MSFTLSLEHTQPFLSEKEVDALAAETIDKVVMVHQKKGPGSDFLGWVDLASSTTDAFLGEVEEAAATLRKKCDAVVVIGIGGSYLGAKAVMAALANNFTQKPPQGDHPEIYFAGNNISEDYLAELLDVLGGREYGLVVISKSGTTTEPAMAFRVLKKHLEEEKGRQEAGSRIVAITDARRGALHTLAVQEGYRTFVIPDDVGGRYSVLTPVGLLPIAIAGYDIRALVRGAADMEELTCPGRTFRENPAAQYAAVRNLLYRQGKKIEILVNYQPKLHFFSEWWKQLFGESEGKDGKGIYPAAVDFTTDLHSLGQYIQEGERILFETVISVEQPERKVVIPQDAGDLDNLNYLAGKRFDEVNKMAELGTLLAHIDGGVPNIRISIEKLDEYHLGQMIYFFEKACAISGYLLGVNPFNQPGVEAYKRNMFALLGKPGFEEETKKIREKLK